MLHSGASTSNAANNRIVEQTLHQYAKSINDMLKKEFRRNLEVAVEAGGHLQKAHDECVSLGQEWNKWVKKNLVVSLDTADLYRLLWRERAAIASCSSIKDARSVLTPTPSRCPKTSEGANTWGDKLDRLEKTWTNVIAEMMLLVDVPHDKLEHAKKSAENWIGVWKKYAAAPFRAGRAPEAAKCKHCGMDCLWCTTAKGKRMLMQPGGDKFRVVNGYLAPIGEKEMTTDQSYSRHFCREQAAARDSQ